MEERRRRRETRKSDRRVRYALSVNRQTRSPAYAHDLRSFGTPYTVAWTQFALPHSKTGTYSS